MQNLGSIGISASTVIKIRRRISSQIMSPNVSANDLQSLTEIGGLGKPKRKSNSRLDYLDKNYVKLSSIFWTSGISEDTKEIEVTSTSQTDKDETSTYLEELESNIPYKDIVAPEIHEIIAGGDIIFISSAQVVVEKMLKSIMGESDGLKILTSDVFALPGFGTEIVECVVSHTNPYLGELISSLSEPFSKRYKLGLITVRSNNAGTQIIEIRIFCTYSNNSKHNVQGVKRGRTRSSDDAENNSISSPRMDSFRGHIFSRLDSSRSKDIEMTPTKNMTDHEAEMSQSARNLEGDIEVSDNTLGIGDTILAGFYISLFSSSRMVSYITLI